MPGVPMRTPEGEKIGALQPINCKPDFAARLVRGDAIEGTVQRFTARHEQLAGSLASQAAVAIQNRRLYENIRELFEGFVKASVTAIESRDPTTSGHSARVANLTVGLAAAINRVSDGPHQLTHFSAEEMTELRYAALLHDFGKVGVREQVLVKAKKLLPAELDGIRQRVELIKRGLELRYAGKKIEHLVEKGRRRYATQAAAFDAELAAYVATLDQGIARIVAANEPAVLPRDFAAGIERLALDVFEGHLWSRESGITPEEAEILAIPRGSLPPAEFKEIQSHVIHTYEFLTRIPWTREFRRIPEIARSHHEKLDGTGYPEGPKAAKIPLQSRMMKNDNIYAALTAAVRPYNKSFTSVEALDILEHERQAGHLDGALLDVFVEAKIYEQVRVPAVSPSATDRRRPMR